MTCRGFSWGTPFDPIGNRTASPGSEYLHLEKDFYGKFYILSALRIFSNKNPKWSGWTKVVEIHPISWGSQHHNNINRLLKNGQTFMKNFKQVEDLRFHHFKLCLNLPMSIGINRGLISYILQDGVKFNLPCWLISSQRMASNQPSLIF